MVRFPIIVLLAMAATGCVFQVPLRNNPFDPDKAYVSGSSLTVYVTTTGNDTNSGLTTASPIKTIQKALDKYPGVESVYVKIAAGDYTPGNGLNSSSYGVYVSNNYSSSYNLFEAVETNLNFKRHLLGGWNTDFTVQSGYSRLNASLQAGYTVVYVYASPYSSYVRKTEVLLDHLVILNATASGVKFTTDYCSIASSCIISNNANAGGNGGGVYVNADYCTIAGIICSNAASRGAGVYLDHAYYNTITAVISNNNATTLNGGGGIRTNAAYYNNNYSAADFSGGNNVNGDLGY